MRLHCVAVGLVLTMCLGASALAQGKPPAPGAAAIWAAAPTEALPQELGQAIGRTGLKLLPGGALQGAGQTVAAARRALSELRCTEALSALQQAEERLLAEVSVEDGRALLGQLEALSLACADRLGDAARATRAADRLLMTGAPVPPDVQLILLRYRPGVVFGPTPAPVQVSTDPKGGQVVRNLLKIGAAPVEVPGGNPEVDLLDVEMQGFRKVHRPLGTGEKIDLGLRPEDRLPVLVDGVAAKQLFGAAQAEALRLLGPALRAGGSSRVVVFAPAQQGGAAAPGERLRARVYDLGQGRWLGPENTVAAGPAARQAEQLAAIAASGGALIAGAKPAAKAAPKDRSIGGFLKLPFTRTKWYSWVIAGGVAAVIAGLLIAERVGSDQVTIEATR